MSNKNRGLKHQAAGSRRCNGRTFYLTREDAVSGAQEREAYAPDRVTLIPYDCPLCDGWHVRPKEDS